LEDVIEEIVGEIQDEFDHEESFVQKKGKSKYEIDARLSIEDAQRELGLQLPDEEFDTVGGFIYHLVGRVPQKNEIVNYQGHEFKVLSLEGNRIKKVMVNFSEGGSDK
jgi:CBS domain containing-hemolysin-like protein